MSEQGRDCQRVTLTAAQIKGYPKYHMMVGGKAEWLTLTQAGAAYDNGFVRCEFGEWVLDGPDATPRNMTPEDRTKISDAADRYSESK